MNAASSCGLFDYAINFLSDINMKKFLKIILAS